MSKPLLKVDDLSLSTKRGKEILKNVSLDLVEGGSLGLLGSSGSGKSTLALAIKGLTRNSFSMSGRIIFNGTELVRGKIKKEIGMIFQDVASSINPAFTVYDQLSDVISESKKVSKADARALAEEMLINFGIGSSSGSGSYPHQLSGGMKQRFLVAMGIATEPSLLIADEPSSSLDIFASTDVLKLIDEYRKSSGCALILISHDLSVLRAMVSDVAVMDEGRIKETGSLLEVIDHPKSDAAKLLVDSELTVERALELRLSRQDKQADKEVADVKSK